MLDPVMRFCTQGLSRIHSFVRPGHTKRNLVVLAARAYQNHYNQ